MATHERRYDELFCMTEIFANCVNLLIQFCVLLTLLYVCRPRIWMDLWIEHDVIKYSIHVRYGMSDTTLDRDTDTVHER